MEDKQEITTGYTTFKATLSIKQLFIFEYGAQKYQPQIDCDVKQDFKCTSKNN